MPDEKDPKTAGTVEGKDDDQGDLTPEQIEEMNKGKKLAAEAAKYRKQLRDTEKKLQERDEEFEALQAKIKEGSASDQQSKSEAAQLKREVQDLRDEMKKRAERERVAEEKLRKKSISSSAATIVTKAGILEPDTAIDYLSSKMKVAEDDTVVFAVRDKDSGEPIEVEATAENVKKFGLLPAIFYPAAGVTGTGSRGGSATQKGSPNVVEGVDLERAKTDTAYFRENLDKIRAARKKLIAAR